MKINDLVRILNRASLLQQMIDDVGITSDYLSRISTGYKNPSTALAAKIISWVTEHGIEVTSLEPPEKGASREVDDGSGRNHGLEAALKVSGLSIDKLGNALGIAASTMRRILNGDGTMPWTAAMQLTCWLDSAGYEIPISDFGPFPHFQPMGGDRPLVEKLVRKWAKKMGPMAIKVRMAELGMEMTVPQVLQLLGKSTYRWEQGM